MKIHRDINNLPQFHNAVITIGSYDGVHSGHQKIINKLKRLAFQNDGESVIITFSPHPRKVLQPNGDLLLLNTIDEKINQCEVNGVDHLIIVPFSKEFSDQSPKEYIEEFLLARFNPKYIVIGYDHKFGKNRVGDITLLKEYESKYNFQVVEIQKHELEDIAISSTKIRKALLKADVEIANSFLGYHYSLTGTVVKGDQIGRDIGYPTANIEIVDQDKLIPGDGIFIVYIDIDGDRYQGMMYIGNRPTIKGESVRKLEVNIFDFDEDIYGSMITIHFIRKVREDIKFVNMDQLKEQLALDKIATLEYFNQNRKPKVTIAILNYNGEEYLESYLPKISFSSENDIEVLLIDNNSSDDSVEYVQEWHPEIKIHQIDENLGYAGGYNEGMKSVTTPYVALVNSDVLVTDGWIDPIIEILDKRLEVGVVQPKILSLENKNSFEYAGAAGGYIDALGYPFCRGRIFDTLEEDNGQYDDEVEIHWASGAAMVIRTELYRSLGGFDADYFAHMEEIDFCIRLRSSGYQCIATPLSSIYHLGGGTLDYNNPWKVKLNFRNNLFTLLKNEKTTSLLWKIPARLVLDGVAAIKLLLSGQPQGLIAIFKAHMDFYRHFGRTLDSRKKYKDLIEKIKIPTRASSEKIGSILIQYYLLGRKKYTQLKK